MLAAALLSLLASGQDAAFQSAFPEGKERVWIGPDYYANRLLDWGVEDGWLECREGSAKKPMRTVHLLTRSIELPDFAMGVRVGPFEEEENPDAWAGFLIGVGGPGADWRTSALTHHWPGEDGGIFVGVDGRGRPMVRDNGHGEGPRGPGKTYTAESWPRLDESLPRTLSYASVGDYPGEMVLQLLVEPRGDKALVRLTALEGGQKGPVLELEIPAERVRGGIALVSHGSPAGDDRGFRFRRWQLIGPGVVAHPERAFGPVMGTLYTLSDGVLKLTAQMGPLGAGDPGTARLSAYLQGEWRPLAEGSMREHSRTVPFRVSDWDASVDTPYRVEYELDGTRHDFTGIVRREPGPEEELVVAAFTGHDISSAGDKNWNNFGFWWPHADLVEHVTKQDPDFLFFSGDQLYEGGLAGIVRSPLERSSLDYLYHWYRFVWAFRDVLRDRPSVCLPDDHDVYHGNVWGAAGVRAPKVEGARHDADRGGYMQEPAFVNIVHETQTAHLPDPVDPRPLDNGISVYFTRLEYGGVSFGIVADRMFKSSPTVAVPAGEFVNGWPQNPDFDPATEADVEGAVLLGERQLAFLDSWIDDWSRGAELKVMLSQTVFQNVATIPGESTSGSVLPRLQYAAPGEYVEGDQVAADADSNGWPQSGRNRALRILRRGYGFHLAGDQHLPSFTQYGIDAWRDGPYAFCVPSIANLWPRRFFPPTDGLAAPDGAPRYVGDHLDGFGNRMTVWAVANPMQSGVEPRALMDRNPGYGIVRLDKRARTITTECWPRWVDPQSADARQYPGWPITITQLENYRPADADAWLPRIIVEGLERPVVQVLRAGTYEIVYSLRLPTSARQLPTLPAGSYDLRVGDPDRGVWEIRKSVRTQTGETKDARLYFEFD